MNLIRRAWFGLDAAFFGRIRLHRQSAAILLAGTAVAPGSAAGIGGAVDIVILPIIDWDFRFQRPQQLACHLADAGHRVFYLAQRFRARGPAFEITEKRHNIFGVSLRGPARNIYTDTLDTAARDALFASLNELRIAAGLGATSLVVDLPFWWPLAELARRELAWPVVYDCMDLHSGFSTNRPAMLDQEQALMTGADLVVVSSANLEREAAGRARRVKVIRNGCDFEHFSAVKPRRRGPRSVIGYIGAIADWFDADLVADLAERRPDWDFLLIGSTFTASDRRLRRLPNVTMPGEQPYDSLPSWIERFDVAMIPFRRVPLTEATNPVKVYEMLASGKPVVAVPIPEIARLAPLVRLASTASEMEVEILAALAEDDPARVAARREFAAANTWQDRTDQLVSALAGCFPLAPIAVSRSATSE